MARQPVTLRSKMFVAIGAVIAVAFFVLECINYSHLQQESRQDLVAQADLIHGIVMATRRVYHHQFLDSGIELNDRTVGFLPAVALNKISKELKNWDREGVSFRNVSDRPRNLDYPADGRELAILERFRSNRKLDRFSEIYRDSQGNEILQYARPIWTEKYCLKCHGPHSLAPPAIRDKFSMAYDYKVGDLRGILSIRLPAAVMAVRTNRHFRDTLLIGATTFLVVFVVIAFLIHYFGTRPLSLVAGAMERVATNDGSSPEIATAALTGEFSMMRRCFNAMTDRIASEKTKLESLAGRYQSLAEGTRAVPWVVDVAAHRVVYFGPQSATVLGYLAESWRTVENWSSRIHADDRAEVVAALGRLADHDLEYRLVGPEGNVVWVQSLANVEAGGSYDQNLVGVLIDISRRKKNEFMIAEAAETQARLLREVNHRVRNNLTSLMGMARLDCRADSMRGDGAEESNARKFEQRLAGLIEVHEMLSETTWRPLRLTDLCRRILATTVQSFGPAGKFSVEVEGSDLSVDPDQAHHLALVVSELAVNTIKHAGSPDQVTTIQVGIDLVDDRIQLVYRDDGNGFPDGFIADPSSGTGVGAGLMRGLVGHSLRGEIRLRNETGAVTEISFPVA